MGGIGRREKRGKERDKYRVEREGKKGPIKEKGREEET